MGGIDRSGASDFKLGDWWVRVQSHELERGEETVQIEARSMQVLVCLARHAPEVVSKDRLIEEVWSESPFVGDDAISHAIWELRKALGDSARNPSYIRTVPRRGYQIVAEILRPQGAPLPMEGVRIDHYDLKAKLGQGAMGVVYEAVDRQLGRTVAIKFLAPDLTRDAKACRRFEREARLAASLDHPNLATVHEIGETSRGHRYLVAAYYAGGSLKDRLAQGTLEEREAVGLLRQLVAGLGVAHGRGIVHRDIKPANLLLDEHGILKICDFGIAKLLGGTDLTRTGTPLGTPAYKSPEQTQGLAVDHRTDLWSAGVVLFELLTGRRPFDGGFEQAIAHSILSRDPRQLEEARGGPVSEELGRFISKALAKAPEERFQTAEEMAANLEEIEAQRWPPTPSAVLARPGARATGVGSPGSMSRAAFLTAAALASLAALWMVGSGIRPEVSSAPEQTQTSPGGEGLDPRIDGAELEKAQLGNRLLQQGRTLWLRGNHPENLAAVKKHFEQALERMPTSAEAWGHLAAFYADQYYIFSTAEEHRQAAARFADAAFELDSHSALATLAHGRLRLMAGSRLEGEPQTKAYEEGEALGRKALALTPTCPRDELCDLAYIVLADALWMQDRRNEALAVLEEGVAQGGGYIRCRLKQARFFEKLGDSRKAENAYYQVLEWDEFQTTALNELSDFLLKSGRADEALPFLRRLSDQSEDPRALLRIGYALYENELWDQAVNTYQKAHRIFREQGEIIPTPLVAIGDVFLEQSKMEEARVYFSRALDVFEAIEDPGVVRQAQRAVCLAKLGRYEEAEAAIGLLLEEEHVPDMLVYAARIYAWNGDREALFRLAHQWMVEDGNPQRFLDDAAFIAFRKNLEYLRILKPGLVQEPE